MIDVLKTQVDALVYSSPHQLVSIYGLNDLHTCHNGKRIFILALLRRNAFVQDWCSLSKNEFYFIISQSLKCCLTYYICEFSSSLDTKSFKLICSDFILSSPFISKLCHEVVKPWTPKSFKYNRLDVVKRFLTTINKSFILEKLIVLFLSSLFFVARKWTAGGPVGPVGAVVHQVFAREINVFEQELAPVPYRVKMESTVMRVTVRSKRTAWVSMKIWWIIWTILRFFIMNSHSRSYPNARKSTLGSQKKCPRVNEKGANIYQHIPEFSTSQDTATVRSVA